MVTLDISSTENQSETVSDTFVLNYTFLSEHFNRFDPLMLVMLLFPSFNC
jgi:hypothetical protein